MKKLDSTISLDYQLPNGETIQLKLATEELLGVRMNKNVKRLLSCQRSSLAMGI